MDLISKIKDHILVTLTIIGVGIFAVIASIVQGYFGLAVTAFLGLLACAAIFVFVLPIALMDKGDNK
ncbi:MAG: hypothetical protein V1647_03430 [Pseudomonadota bacterium]